MKIYILLVILLLSISLDGQNINKDIERICESNSISEIELIIKNTPAVLSFKQFDNRNILFRINTSNLDKTEVLLKHGANPNELDDGGWSPLTYNTSNFNLYNIYLKYGGVIILNDNHKTDYISKLVFDYTEGSQEGTYKILEDVLIKENIDLNKLYQIGHDLSHMLVINYLTYSVDTNFDQLINLFESNGLVFSNPLEMDFNNENYPYHLKKDDTCLDIVSKISKHEFYNGRNLDYILEKCKR